MELILVRHAEAESRETDDGTPADPGLTTRGRDQAAAAAAWFARESIDRILSSPSRRARQTAEALEARVGIAVEIDPRLSEVDPLARSYRSIEAERARGGEGYRRRVAAYQEDPRLVALSERVDASLSEWAQRTPGGRVVVFCHGGVINVWTRLVLGMTPGVLFEPRNASGQRFLISREGVRTLRSLNEVAYLEFFESSSR